VTRTYLAAHVLEQLDRAQAAIERHVAGPHGRCVACGEIEPCRARITAQGTFARYQRLPVRTPGLAIRVTGQHARFGWFAGSPAVEALADGVESPR
jgi:hypothetical protein